MKKTNKKMGKGNHRNKNRNKKNKKDKKSNILRSISGGRCRKRLSYGFCDGLPLTVNPSLYLFSLASINKAYLASQMK
jgi:hypothetical protein